MTSLFLDSSALAKRYLPEVGTSWLRQQILSSDSIIVSRITSVEVMSAVARRQREKTLSPAVVTGINRLLNKHLQQKYLIIGINHQITTLAIQLLMVHPLRAYDAIQLASAKFVAQRLVANDIPPITFLCADVRLLVIAQNEGLNTDNPGDHP